MQFAVPEFPFTYPPNIPRFHSQARSDVPTTDRRDGDVAELL